MRSAHGTNELPDMSLDQCTVDELTKLVRKLRWIGLDEEAERAQRMLSQAAPSGGVLTASHGTD